MKVSVLIFFSSLCLASEWSPHPLSNFLPGTNSAERLSLCMEELNSKPYSSFEATVLRIGPSLRRISERTMKKAVVVMEFQRHEKHVVVLKAISDRSLRTVTQSPIDVSANDLIFLSLTRLEYDEFKSDSSILGTIDVTFKESEIADSIRPGIVANLSLGTVLEIGVDDYIIVDKTTIEDRGVRHPRLILAKFENLNAASFTTEFHTLDIGADLLYALDGEYVSIDHDFGQATIVIQKQIGPSSNSVMSATVVDWKSGEVRHSKIVPSLQLDNFKLGRD